MKFTVIALPSPCRPLPIMQWRVRGMLAGNEPLS